MNTQFEYQISLNQKSCFRFKYHILYAVLTILFSCFFSAPNVYAKKTKKTKIEGSIAIREKIDHDENGQTQYGFQGKANIEIKHKQNDSIDFILNLEMNNDSGTPPKPTSSWNRLETDQAKTPLTVEHLYGKFESGRWNLRLGRFADPIKHYSQLVFDDDLDYSGYAVRVDAANHNLRLAQSLVRGDTAFSVLTTSGFDSKYNLSEEFEFSYLGIFHYISNSSALGSSTFAPTLTVNNTNTFQIMELGAGIKYDGWSAPISIYTDCAYNIKITDAFGMSVGANVGEVKKLWDFLFETRYHYLQRNTSYEPFARGDDGLDTYGFEISTTLSLGDFGRLTVTNYFDKRISTGFRMNRHRIGWKTNFDIL